jgi:hypothetical protein
MEQRLVVRARMRELGLCRLPHEWELGAERHVAGGP